MCKDIEKVIFEMLTENTGRHMLDSGGAYGRNWERNQALTIQDFKNRPGATLEVSIYTDKEGNKRPEFIATVDVFHFLTGRLSIDDYCERFNSRPVENWDSEKFYGVSSQGEKWLRRVGFTQDRDQGGFNTYNWCSNHSQVLQGDFLEGPNQESYVLLQIHGGCDVRGGYTDAKLFCIESLDGPYDILRDDCGFSVEIPEKDNKTVDMFTGRTHDNYMSLDFYGGGDIIEPGGCCASDEYMLKFAEIALESGDPDKWGNVYLQGDCFE